MNDHNIILPVDAQLRLSSLGNNIKIALLVTTSEDRILENPGLDIAHPYLVIQLEPLAAPEFVVLSQHRINEFFNVIFRQGAQQEMGEWDDMDEKAQGRRAHDRAQQKCRPDHVHDADPGSLD